MNTRDSYPPPRGSGPGSVAQAGAAFLLSILVSSGLGAEDRGTSGWFFRPVGGEPHNELVSVSGPLDPKDWTPVKLPHDFSRIQKAPNVFGWYVRQVFVPEAYKGLDLFLDLGMIDDADATFFNGRAGGGMGDFHNQALSAWNQHRRYCIPAQHVRTGQANTVAVLVKNFTGLGGLLGQPFCGASLLKEPKARFAAGDLPAEKVAEPAFDDSKWAEIVLPDEQWDKRIPTDPAYGWYRMRFDLPEPLAGRDLLLDLGMVYDAAAAYLNGKPIGQCGTFPPDFFPQTAGRFRCIAPSELLQPKANLLAVRVFNDEQFGGLVGLPSVDFELAERLAPYGKSAKEWAASLPKAFGQPYAPALAFDLSECLVHSGRLEEGLALAVRCAERPGATATERQKALARSIYALFLSGKRDEAWLRFQKLDFAQPIPFEAAYSASAICRQPAFAPARLVYLGPDTSTGPDWDLHYGNGFAVLSAMGAPFDFRFGAGPVKYSLETGDPREHPRSWLGKRETPDRRALFNPLSRKLRYSSWDDAGERHPCDDAGPDLILHIPIPSGNQLLTFYLVDFDWFNGQHPRLETLILLDEANRPLFVLGTGRFGRGRYERFLVEGPMNLTVRICKHRSACAVLSGFFLDKIVPLQACPLSLRKGMEADGPLKSKYQSLAAQSSNSLLKTLADAAFTVFEKDCRTTPGARSAKPEVLWWLAECERVRARPWAQVACLGKLLDAVAPKGAQNSEDLAREKLGPLGLQLEKLGFCNKVLLLCIERFVASAPERRPMYLRELRRGSLEWRGPSGQPKEATK